MKVLEVIQQVDKTCNFYQKCIAVLSQIPITPPIGRILGTRVYENNLEMSDGVSRVELDHVGRVILLSLAMSTRSY